MKHELTAKRLIQALSDSGFTAQELAHKSGVSKSSISQYVNGSHKPSNISAGKISNILNVNPMWLMGFDVPMEKAVDTLTVKNERDIERTLKETLAQLDAQDGLMFDGEALDDNTKELLKISLENTIRTAKIAAKKKFTPKSIQNGDD